MPAPDPARSAKWRAQLLALKPWALPAAALVLAVLAAAILWSKLQRDVWSYYTDGEGQRTEVGEDKTRPVLWQDPEPQHFDEPPGGGANRPTGTLEAAFSADGTAMVLVRWDEQRGDADLYLSIWDGRTWSRPQALDALNTEASERSPTLSQDGRFLYFASDRPGGAGGYDLFVARREGGEWKDARPLPAEINSAANELGPAFSPDGTQLFFSSDREGEGEDIYVSQVVAASGDKGAPPRFAVAAPVDDLNSKAADVQAAMTSRGDHVFLASDRDRDGKSGFRVYISRVVDGEPSPPEEVDLYITEGDITDPAVRMDGFDLLFSSGKAPAEDGEGYRLYRSTTREVVGYTDLSRWELFKELMGKIKWWILLAAAALIAMIYILEKWQDMTSLFHKCLAGSGLLHLIILLLTMAKLIVNKIDEQQPEKRFEDVTLSIEALAQEELALESIPQETQLTDTTTNIESEKVESDFGAPGFEAKEQAQAMPDATQLAKESLLAETQPAMSAPAEQAIDQAAQASSLLQDLAETVLPEIDAPRLEEREPSEQQEIADSSADVFEPEEVEVPDAAKSELSEVADAAQQSETQPAEVSDLQNAESLVDRPMESVVAVTPSEIEESLPLPSETPPLDSAVLTDLTDLQFEEPAEVAFEERLAEPQDSAPANPADDLFDPAGAVASLSTEPAQSGAAGDSAVADAADAGEVAAGATSGSAAAEAFTPSAIGEATSSGDDSLPPAAMDSGGLGGLPDIALADPGAPLLEEPAGDAGAPASEADDLFTPDQAAPGLATVPAESGELADSAMAERADVAAVSGGELVAGSPVIESRAPDLVTSSMPDSIPPAGANPPALGSLPAQALVDPGAPILEEPARAQPAGSPADPSQDRFTPAGGAPQLTTSQQPGAALADSAVDAPSDATVVPAGGIVADSALSESRPPVGTSGSAKEEIPPTALGSATMPELPEVALVDTGAPPMEEPVGAKLGGAPRNPAAEQFEPGGAEGIRSSPAAERAVADAAVSDRSGAGSISGAALDASASAPVGSSRLEAQDPASGIATGVAAAELGGVTPMPALLPSELEVDRTLGSEGIAKLIKKQRGKPGIDTIREMGGSDGSERAISAAIGWLVKVQEKDGRWDTAKHGSKQDYDTGGTGLALLCFYGWGERHDRECKYQQSVRRGLEWLVGAQREDGYLGGRPGMMYSHAIATIALCEAYGVTGDPALRDPAERAIAYTIAAQSPRLGGWRYSPGNDSDTSVTGWQFMALHSARMAGLEVPEEPFDRARAFLDQMGGGKHGGLYGYQERGKLSRAMVATGMFCRQLDLVPPSHPMMQESARILKLHPMRASNPDLYYVYYATLALYQHQGPIWRSWNDELQRILPVIQEDDGSWKKSSSMAGDGGRVVSTALATLSLEVYYRLLPMYGYRNEEAPAPELKQREDP